MYSIEEEKYGKGEHELQIELGNLTKGIYYANFIADTRRQNFKLIHY